MPADRMRVNGATLATESFGAADDPAVLLIAGAAAAMTSWPAAFCTALAAAGRFVVRYDHRDTGRSEHFQRGAPPYDTATLVRDATGLLDGYGIARAHLAGISLGGQVAQLIALDRPQRVASLTLVASSPAPLGAADPDLPRPSLATLCDFDDIEPPDWSAAAEVEEYLLAMARIRAGSARAFDEPAARAVAAETVARGTDVQTSMINHGLLDHGAPWRERLPQITAPALVVHGAADPLFPLAHGRALAAAIPGAVLLTLPRAGHDLAGSDWPALLEAMLRHTSTAAGAAR